MEEIDIKIRMKEIDIEKIDTRKCSCGDIIPMTLFPIFSPMLRQTNKHKANQRRETTDGEMRKFMDYLYK
jgi:hypothetical protein